MYIGPHHPHESIRTLWKLIEENIFFMFVVHIFSIEYIFAQIRWVVEICTRAYFPHPHPFETLQALAIYRLWVQYRYNIYYKKYIFYEKIKKKKKMHQLLKHPPRNTHKHNTHAHLSICSLTVYMCVCVYVHKNQDTFSAPTLTHAHFTHTLK